MKKKLLFLGAAILTFMIIALNLSYNKHILAANAVLQPKINLEISNGQVYSSGNTIDIKGWSLNSSGTKAVDVWIDGKYVKTLDCILPRPDVKNAFPQYQNAENSGYDYKTTLSNGAHKIRVYNIGNDGKVIYNEVKIIVAPALLQAKINLEINDGQVYLNDHSIDVKGWALSNTGIKLIDLYVDGKYVKTLDCNLSRPDVKNVFPQYQNAENSGYDYSLDSSKYDIGNHIIKVYAIGDTGILTSTSSNIDIQPSNVVTYKDAISAADLTYSGLQFITDSTTGVPHAGFDYLTKSTDSHAGFNIGLAAISAYMATGDEKYLNVAKSSANFLSSILPSTGLAPEYSLVNRSIDENSITFLGTSGQATTLEFVSYLARIDSSYIPLMKKLANGMINYGINKYNNLPWGQVCTISGKPFGASNFESQLGSVSSSCAEALLAAYETDNTNIQYKNSAINILKAIWNTRNLTTNLIPETWDILNNKIGTHLYPYGDFRYDDMGGAYIRALMLGYNVTKSSDLFDILKTYVPALANAVWDPSLNGGAFRYLTNINGGHTSLVNVEIMHGLFISTLLEANSMIGPNNGDILNKATTHANNILMTDFGVKNFMVPHQISSTGTYINSASDSQLGYAVIQYPLGYELLSQKTGDSKYRLRDNQIFNTLLSRHKIGDNINSPKGYLNIVETTPPYGFEYDYNSPSWMFQSLYMPSYILFNSIHPSSSVTIDWQHGLAPSTFGLIYDMPFWDLNNVKVQDRTLHLDKVSGSGTIDLTDMGFGNIKSIKCDKNNYSNFSNSTLNTEDGTHSYDISWDN